MKFASHMLLFIAAVVMLFSCDSDEDVNLREATFTVFFLNRGDVFCNEGQLSFEFLITYPNGTQESINLAPTEEYQKTISVVSDNDLINLKIFFPSAEEPVKDGSYQFIFNGVSDEELEPPGNELFVSYCHNENEGLIWNVFY